MEDGKPAGPINVMRVDESLHHIFGEGLQGLTQERDHRFEGSTYQRRSEAGAVLPGALVEDFTLTL